MTKFLAKLEAKYSVLSAEDNQDETAKRVSYQDFDKVMDLVKSGKAMFWVITNLKKVPIKKKNIDSFAKSGLELLAKDKDGKGFRLQQGKNSVYVLPSSLWTSSANY